MEPSPNPLWAFLIKLALKEQHIYCTIRGCLSINQSIYAMILGKEKGVGMHALCTIHTAMLVDRSSLAILNPHSSQ